MDTTRTARKPHWCSWCRREIETGQIYEAVTVYPSDDGAIAADVPYRRTYCCTTPSPERITRLAGGEKVTITQCTSDGDGDDYSDRAVVPGARWVVHGSAWAARR